MAARCSVLLVLVLVDVGAAPGLPPGPPGEGGGEGAPRKTSVFRKKRPLVIKGRRPYLGMIRLLLSARGSARSFEPASMLPVIKWVEWLWSRQPFLRDLAIYRVAILARKPGANPNPV